MSDRKDESHKNNDTGRKTRRDEVDLESSGEVTVLPKRSLPTPPEDKRIHPRRPLPLVPEAPDEDESDS